MAGYTNDSFFNGRLKVAQFHFGYRYSIDAIILAAFPRLKPGECLIDLGTGCGIIPLILAFRFPDAKITGIEVQMELAQLAQKNVASNKMEDRIQIIHADMRYLSSKKTCGPVDWIVSNPPYRRSNSGRINPNSQRALARHEINVNLEQLLDSTKRLLKTGGRFVTIYPSERTADLISTMRTAGIEPKLLQCIHSRAHEAAKLVLVCGIAGGKPGLKINSPLIIYDENGQYSKAIQEMMRP